MKMKKTMRALSLLITLAFIGAVFVPVASAYDDSGSENLVTSEYGEKVAEAHLIQMSTDISEYSDWNGADLTQNMILYKDENNIAAYLYNVVKGDKYLGFILVSADRSDHPVLAFGKGYMINEKSLNSVEAQATKYANENNCIIENTKYYYLGPTFYFVGYDLSGIKSDSNENPIYYDLFTGNKENLDFKTTSQNNKYSDEMSSKITEEWNTVDNEISSMELGTNSLSSVKGTSYLISGVPMYDQPSGTTNYCSPTAAGMVVGYWDSHGYSGLPSGDTAIMALGTAMGTTSSGTNQYNIDDGMETVYSDYGYSYFDVIEDTWITFSEVKSETGNDRPFVYALSNHPTYGDHSVTAVGYIDSTTDYVTINDGWSITTASNIAFGNNAIAVYTQP